VPPQPSLKIVISDERGAIRVPATEDPRPLTSVLRDAGFPLNTRCAERGLCDGCAVEVLEGALINLVTNDLVEARGVPLRVRACQHRLARRRSATIRVPSTSRLAGQPQVVSRFLTRVPFEVRPLHRVVQLTPEEQATLSRGNQSLEQIIAHRLGLDRVASASRLREGNLSENGRAALHVGVERLREGWAITDVSPKPLRAVVGAVADVGTTTVVVCLVDLASGQILGEAADFNAQLPFGEDVLTRIANCSRGPDMLVRMQRAVVDQTLAALLNDACARARVPPTDVRCMTVVGNTTMLHLLAGVDPTPIGVAPFTPAFLDHRVVQADDLHLTLASPASSGQPGATQRSSGMRDYPSIHLLPGAAAYIGTDIVAGVLASGLPYEESSSLLIDIGTNGEMVLKHGHQFLACSTAAGPAFEGAGLLHGMRAIEGAISHVSLNEHTLAASVTVIGDKKPAGLCGSAYVDFLGEGRRVGILNRTGRFVLDRWPAAAPPPVTMPGAGRVLPLAGGTDRGPIVITEADIAKLLQAKAAIAAGLQILLQQAGLRPDQVARVYLAGGFGLHLSVSSAIACGLLPGFTADQVVPVGNSALAGAYLALIDSKALDELVRISHQIQVIELNQVGDFEGCFIRQLQLPS
jgi:uncharacterized 2Fe-2S/4Fe-4S cluster protein (DUF4445 family)